MTMLQLHTPHLECFILYTNVLCAYVLYIVCVDKRGTRGKKKKR